MRRSASNAQYTQVDGVYGACVASWNLGWGGNHLPLCPQHQAPQPVDEAPQELRVRAKALPAAHGGCEQSLPARRTHSPDADRNGSRPLLLAEGAVAQQLQPTRDVDHPHSWHAAGETTLSRTLAVLIRQTGRGRTASAVDHHRRESGQPSQLHGGATRDCALAPEACHMAIRSQARQGRVNRVVEKVQRLEGESQQYALISARLLPPQDEEIVRLPLKEGAEHSLCAGETYGTTPPSASRTSSRFSPSSTSRTSTR